MMKKVLLVIVALLAFESFGFLLDAAKLAIGVSAMAVQNIRNLAFTHSEQNEPEGLR